MAGRMRVVAAGGEAFGPALPFDLAKLRKRDAIFTEM
jgi:hypothetical protein